MATEQFLIAIQKTRDKALHHVGKRLIQCCGGLDPETVAIFSLIKLIMCVFLCAPYAVPAKRC